MERSPECAEGTIRRTSVPAASPSLHQSLQQRQGSRSLRERFAKGRDVGLAHQQGVTLELRAVVVAAEPQKHGACRFAFTELQELDGRLVVLAAVRRFLRDQPTAEVEGELSR